jgi:homeobox protein cut-like
MPETKDGEAGPSRAPPADFSTSLARWREIQLPDVQADLESLLPSLVEAQKDALLSRKRLAEQTREFKKLNNESQPDAIKPLLKAYQSEIDSLTKRAKAAETAVLSVRDRLQGAADPYPILELVVEQTALIADVEQMKTQLRRLQASNASLETQLASLPSLEAERTRLSKRVAQLEASSGDIRRKVETELAAKWDERVQNHKARENDAVRSLETVQSQLKELRANHAKVTERLLHHGEEIERDEANGKIEELDMISEELSRSNERAAAMERRNEQLRQQIEQLKNGTGEDQRLLELERRALDAEEQNRRLSKMVEDEAKKDKEMLNRHEAKVRETLQQLQEKEAECETMRKKVRSMADYDELKRELEIFKYVEFAVESDQRLDGEEAVVGETTVAKPLEALLIEKNRQLQDELTGMRVANNESSVTLQNAKTELKQVKGEVETLRKLNEKLEDDLLNVETSRKGAAVPQPLTAEETLAEMDKLGRNASTASATQHGSQDGNSDNAIPFAPSPSPAERANGAAKSSSATSASNILPIITSQRDRFRARNAELEEELRKQVSTITELRTEVKTLQADNLGLYEKVRYLQSYQQGGGAGNASRGGARTYNPAIAARGDWSGASAVYPPTSAGEDKYRERYEASMNPFEAFRGREQSRAINNLNPLERVLHTLTRLVLGHRRMRIFFVVYAVCLHLLVFAMLFEVEFATGSGAGVLQGVTPARDAN